jgi:ribonuclease D
MLITTTKQLTAFCASLKNADFVTVDTEFMRERTYYSILCLVQLGGPDTAAAVDPLAEGIDLTPLYDLLNDPKILKVFHAARQDVEIFVGATGKVPAPMFDTQVAAMVCGFGESASYETLAASLAKAKIDKSSRFTDWARRPLTDKQITYALGDVTHLRDVYAKLNEQLEKSGHGDWMREEMAVLTDPATYQTDPREIWKRLKLRGGKPLQRALARELAIWRETEAQRLNIPRGRVMKDETLMEIAHHAPRAPEDLARTRGLSNGFAEGRQGKEILAAIARAKALPPSEYPEADPRRVMPNGATAVLDLLKVLLKQVSEEKGVASKLIASMDDLAALAAEENPDVKALTGWRRELFGNDALALKRGELALAVHGHKVVLLRDDKKPR